MKKILFLTIFILISIVSFTHAVPIGIGNFSGSETVIDFNNIASGEAITNQYSGFGVTFSGSPFLGDPFPTSTINGTMSGANHLPINNPITATFSSIQTQVGMYFGTILTQNNTVQINAFMGASLVDTQNFLSLSGNTLPGGTLATVFAGIFSNGGFDRIEFSNISFNRAFQIDDFRFENTSSAPVPEPATMLLFGLGILGLAGVSRKKLSK